MFDAVFVVLVPRLVWVVERLVCLIVWLVASLLHCIECELFSLTTVFLSLGPRRRFGKNSACLHVVNVCAS